MIRQVFLIITLFTSTLLFSQKSENWVLMDKEPITTLSLSKSETLSVNEFSFQATWDNKLSYSENLGYYGGISELQVFKNNKLIQMIKNIEDGIGLGEISFTFYDYNMDGYTDFKIPIDCGKSCYDAYYLFNPQTEKFEHQKEWDYLQIEKINKKRKQILTVPDGNATQVSRVLFQVMGNKLTKIKPNSQIKFAIYPEH